MIILCFGPFLFVYAAPASLEPESFNGIPWGAHIDTIPGMKKIASQEGIDVYTRENDILAFAGEIVTTIEYYFYQNKFMGVYITFDGFLRFTAIKKSLCQSYGPGKKRNYFLEEYSWLQESLLITLSYTARTGSGSILYCYLPLWEKHLENEKKDGTQDHPFFETVRERLSILVKFETYLTIFPWGEICLSNIPHPGK
ncbi:MAG: hypothetical protein JXD19_09125 [Deltaproteobacteria bacterium]|nr:hypothetical protein [Deltaproteobacteria bacterium]